MRTPTASAVAAYPPLNGRELGDDPPGGCPPRGLPAEGLGYGGERGPAVSLKGPGGAGVGGVHSVSLPVMAVAPGCEIDLLAGGSMKLPVSGVLSCGQHP